MAYKGFGGKFGLYRCEGWVEFGLRNFGLGFHTYCGKWPGGGRTYAFDLHFPFFDFHVECWRF